MKSVHYQQASSLHGSKMFILIIFTVLAAYFYYRTKDYIFDDIQVKNHSKTATPLIKNGFGMAFMNRERQVTYVRECAQKLKKSYRRSFFGIQTYNIIRASDAEKILSSSKHIEKSIIYKILQPFLKTGLLTSGGEKWFKRRRLLTPTFHFHILKDFCEIFKEETEKLVKILTNEKAEVNIIPLSTQFTLNTICESAMGVKLSSIGDNGEIYRSNIYVIGKLIVDRINQPWLYIESIYKLLGYKKKFQEILKPVHDFTKAIIKKRRNDFMEMKKSEAKKKLQTDENENIYMGSKKKRYAMMDTLLQAQSEGLIDDEGIIEETDTFTFEGHDTTSAGMTFTLLLLAHHPEVQEKLFEEIQDVIGQSRSQDGLSVEDFNKMNYMERVIKESLRIYPPVHFISRAFSEDTQIAEIIYKKDSVIEIYIFDIHRDPEVFPDPEKFDPDRFLPEECEKRSNFAFLAFSAGMRNCIGQRFAMLELKVMLTKIIQNFIIHSVTKREDLVFVMDLVLRTKNPILLKFVPRKLK